MVNHSRYFHQKPAPRTPAGVPTHRPVAEVDNPNPKPKPGGRQSPAGGRFRFQTLNLAEARYTLGTRFQTSLPSEKFPPLRHRHIPLKLNPMEIGFSRLAGANSNR